MKRELIRKIRKIRKIIIGLVSAIVIVFVVNRILLKNEETLIENYPKNLVEVDGNLMNVHVQGTGSKTLVFLSGAGTPSPVLDFKSLYDRLSAEYRIVIIERFGYGFSDVISNDRTFDTILKQSREALTKAGIEGKYILVPHSMSGLEAIRWAQLFPNEVEAIIGLDMSVPKSYDKVNFNTVRLLQTTINVLRETGLVKVYYLFTPLPKVLTKEEKETYIAIASKKLMNNSVVSEGKTIQEAIRQINENPKPHTPILLFSSNGKGTGVDNWRDIQKEYLSDLKNSKIVSLETGHYVHYEEYEKISQEIKEYILGFEN